MDGEESQFLTMLDTFKLYVWVLWKSGIFEDSDVRNILEFTESMNNQRTAFECLSDLDQFKPTKENTNDDIKA